jgi:CRP/FNR family transcriptional regulator, cyclic AMP receptor protein
MKKAGTCDLNTCFLCQHSIPEWIAAVSDHRQHLFYRKNETIFQEGSPVKGIFFLYDGKVKVHKQWGAEKELIVRFAQKGDIVGHRGIGGTEHYYPISATALEPVKVCFIEMDFFQASLKINHDLLYELMLFYAQELQTSEKQMRNLAHMSVKGRMANALILLQQKFGFNKDGFIDLALSKQDLASYIGATYETTFRVLNELIEERLVAVSGKSITILNEDKLLRLTATS